MIYAYRDGGLRAFCDLLGLTKIKAWIYYQKAIQCATLYQSHAFLLPLATKGLN